MQEDFAILGVCVTDSVRKLIANSKKKKKKKKSDDNPIRLFYCNNILHTYIIFIDGVGYFQPCLNKLNFILEIY
mgnify:CR=1 FL=1